MYKETGLPAAETRCRRHLASLYRQTGRLAEAEQALRGALPDRIASGDREGIVGLIALGELLTRTGRNEAAEHHFRRALQLCPKKKLMFERSEALAGLGGVLTTMKRFPEAEKAFRQALEIEMGEQGRHVTAALIHQSLYALYRSQDEIELAHRHLLQSNQMFKHARIPEYVAMSNFELSSFHLARMDHSSALELFNDAFARYTHLGKYQSAARIALQRAHQLIRDSDPGRNPIGEANSLALPAFLHLDRIRFQFDTSSDRQRWAGFVEWATTRTFQIAAAAGDRQLVADLIETRINSAAHTPAASNLPVTSTNQLSALADTLFSETASVNALTAAGSSRLLAGSSLPAQPGPLLLVPTNATVVGHRWALGDIYRASVYPLSHGQRAVAIF